MKDWTNRNSTFVQLGASNHSEKEREENDFYATDPKALELFLDKLDEDKIELHNKILEPACRFRTLKRSIKAKRL